MRMGSDADLPQRTRDAYDQVRDLWLANKDYAALVKAIVGNWTSGNCVEYMLPVTASLLKDNKVALHRYLWAKTVSRQIDGFFREYRFIRSGSPTLENVLATDRFMFDESEWSHYDDHAAAASFCLRRIMSSLAHWRSELATSGLQTREPDEIDASLRQLTRPRIQVDRVPPG